MAQVNLALANWMREWIEDTLDAYFVYLEDGGDEVKIIEKSADWDSKGYVRASSINKCAKRHAAERAGVIEKLPISAQSRYIFRFANVAALEAKAALKWAIERPGQTQWSFASELRDHAADIRLAGTPDVMITCIAGGGKQIMMPTEIKRTDTDYYEGILASYVWQTIAYMLIQERNGMDARFGYTYTLYGGKEKNKPTHHVWLIQRVENGWQVMDGNRPYHFKGTGYPALPNGDNLFTDEAVMEMLDKHHEWYDAFAEDVPNTRSRTPDLLDPYNWDCSQYVAPQFYQKNYRGNQKGDRKFGTGTMKGLCPLFGECWKDLMPTNWTPDEDLPSELHISFGKDGVWKLGIGDSEVEDDGGEL